MGDKLYSGKHLLGRKKAARQQKDGPQGIWVYDCTCNEPMTIIAHDGFL